MKKTLLLLALAVTATASAQKPFKMQATLDKDVNITKYYITLEDENGSMYGTPNDSVEVKNNKFTYSTTVAAPIKVLFSPANETEDGGMEMYFLPGENMKLTVKKGEYFFDGSKPYKDINAADLATTPLQQDLMAYYRAAVAKIQALPEAEQQAAAGPLQDTLTMKSTAMQETIDKYLDDHINEDGTVLYLYDKVSAGMEGVYNKLANKDSQVAKYINGKIELQKKLIAKQEEAERKEQERLDALKGKAAPDFTLNDIDGNPLALSSLRGKYVILDFWGSWCGWCIKGIPDMKKYYEKYAGKFEILGVDCNDTEDAWKKAVAKYELPWKHVYNPRTSTLLQDYNVTGFPTKIIIDPEGNFNKVIVGEDPAFYTYLDELLGK